MDWLLAYPMWPKYLGLAVALAAISHARYRACLLVIGAALAAEQLLKFVEVGPSIWIAFSFTWLCVSGAIWRQSVTTALLTLVSATCYAWGRISGHPFAASDPMWISPLFWADMALIAAILFAGGRGAWLSFTDLGELGVGWNAHRRGDPSGGHRAHLHEEAK